MKFLSISTGANHAYIGYQGLAEYMLRHSKKIKYVVLYLYLQSCCPKKGLSKRPISGPIVYDDFDGPRSYLTPPSALLSPYGKFALFELRGAYHVDEPLSRQMPSLQIEGDSRRYPWLDAGIRRAL